MSAMYGARTQGQGPHCLRMPQNDVDATSEPTQRPCYMYLRKYLDTPQWCAISVTNETPSDRLTPKIAHHSA